MRPSPCAALLAVALVAGLGACKGQKPTGASETAAASTPPAGMFEPPAPAKPVAPLTFSQENPDVSVKLTLARDISRWPGLHREVFARGSAELRKFAAAAPGERAEAKTAEYDPPQYARELEWSLAAATPRLVSLRQTWYENTGGAHPNHGYDSYLWDVAANRSIGNAVLFKTGGDEAAVQKALCDGIDKVKTGRGVEWDPESWPCPKWREARFVLTPSTVPGKIGGLTFLFDPYAIGSYAEGEYDVTVPQSVLAPLLAAAYAGEFAGAPKPRKPD
jgi:hypothetical protein